MSSWSDIDGFKGFNDTLGHPAGDHCLRAVAEIISTCILRAGDTVARYGGDEFDVLLADTEPRGAAIVAERIRAAVDELSIDHPAMPSRRLTVSVGAATMRASETREPTTLVRAANAALYRAKQDGRNLVRIAEEERRV